MVNNYILALDAGTSRVRCLIFDLYGKPVATSDHDYSYETPPEIAPLGREINSRELWRIICDCMNSAIKKADIHPEDITGISATSQREGTVFLDKTGSELYAGPNIDLRAVTEGLSLDNSFASTLHGITGHLPSLLFVPARLKWFEKNHPEIYQRISTVLSISDWLVYRLSGVKVSEICGAVEMGIADVISRQHSSELSTILNLSDSIFPELAPAGICVGKITARAASETGIPAGTPVILGAPDSHCGLIGMGIINNGQTGIVSGWSTPVQMVTAKPVFDAGRRIWTGCHILKDKWILESSCGESGNSLRWVRENLFNHGNLPDDQSYALMNKAAINVAPGSEGAMAFIGPEAMDMTDLKMRWGMFCFPVPFSFSGLSKAQLARATMENIGFAIKANIQQLIDIAGKDISTIKIGGGLMRNECLTQILPSILSVPVVFADVIEISALGAAMLAATGSGVYSSLSEALPAMQSPLKVVEPDRLMTAEYAEHFHRWLSISQKLNQMCEEQK